MEGRERNNQVVHDRRPPRFRKRAFVLAILWIVVAAALNYVVAWWCILKAPDWRLLPAARKLNETQAQEFARSIVADFDPQLRNAHASVWTFFGFTHTYGGISCPDALDMVVIQRDAGWPLHALRSTNRFPPGLRSPKPGGFELSPSLRIESLEAGIEWRGSVPRLGVTRRLPLQPLWLGFLANAGVYTTCLLTLTLGAPHDVRRLRAAVRRRRGRCAQCAYDLRGIAVDVCPECGHATRRPSRA